MFLLAFDRRPVCCKSNGQVGVDSVGTLLVWLSIVIVYFYGIAI